MSRLTWVEENDDNGDSRTIYSNGSHVEVTHRGGWMSITGTLEPEYHDCLECGMADSVECDPIAVVGKGQRVVIGRCWACGWECEASYE